MTVSIIASAIAMLVHFGSDPKIMGMGPIITTPPPLTSVLASLSSLDPPLAKAVASNSTRMPARIATIPTVTRSTNTLSLAYRLGVAADALYEVHP